MSYSQPQVSNAIKKMEDWLSGEGLPTVERRPRRTSGRGARHSSGRRVLRKPSNLSDPNDPDN
jgi:hypothetical protein